MRIVFIAGPYIGDGKYQTVDRNINYARAYAIELANRGIGFFCPHNHTEHFEVLAQAPESFYRELDFQILRFCDAILATPRWAESSGARAEIKFAQDNGIRIFFPKSADDLDEIEKWAKEI